MPKAKKSDEIEQRLSDLTADLQRTRADFENYRKRTETEKDAARTVGRAGAILKLLPVIDNIERAIAHTPEHLADDAWAQSVTGLVKSLEKSLNQLGLHRIPAAPGTEFDPTLHEAIAMDDGEGEKEVITEELQAGYQLDDQVIRHSTVRVGRG